ncbi:MAG: DMT family transporter [Bacillota bacterium]
MLLVPLIWSSNFIIGRVLVQYIPPFTMTTTRFGVALILLLAILKVKGLLRRPDKDLYFPLIMLGLSGVFGFNTIIYIGLKYTTAVNSTIVNAFSPIVVGVLSALWLKEKLRFSQATGLLLSFLGIVVIAAKGSWQVLLSLGFNPGDVIVFLATIVWAFFTVLSKMVLSRLSTLETTTYANLAGVIFLVPAMFYEWGGKIPPFTPTIILMLIYLGIFASVLSFLWWNKGVSEIGPTRAAAFYNLIPVYASVLAYFLLGEKLYIYHLIGGLMVLAGVYLGIMKRGERQIKKTQ